MALLKPKCLGAYGGMQGSTDPAVPNPTAGLSPSSLLAQLGDVSQGEGMKGLAAGSLS